MPAPYRPILADLFPAEIGEPAFTQAHRKLTEYRLPIAPVAAPAMTVVPDFMACPPELAYPPQSQTDEPAVVVRERGASRLLYFPSERWRRYLLRKFALQLPIAADQVVG